MTIYYDSHLRDVAPNDVTDTVINVAANFYDMQYVELICVRSNKIGKIMQTHGGDKDWLRDSAIAYVCGVEPRCKVFHYISIRLHIILK